MQDGSVSFVLKATPARGFIGLRIREQSDGSYEDLPAPAQKQRTRRAAIHALVLRRGHELATLSRSRRHGALAHPEHRRRHRGRNRLRGARRRDLHWRRYRARPHAPAHLGRQYDVVPAARESLAHHRLRLTGGVHVGGVDKVDATVERTTDDRVDRCLVQPANRLPDLAPLPPNVMAPRQSSETNTPVSESARYFMMTGVLRGAPE